MPPPVNLWTALIFYEDVHLELTRAMDFFNAMCRRYEKIEIIYIDSVSNLFGVKVILEWRNNKIHVKLLPTFEPNLQNFLSKAPNNGKFEVDIKCFDAGRRKPLNEEVHLKCQ